MGRYDNVGPYEGYYWLMFCMWLDKSEVADLLKSVCVTWSGTPDFTSQTSGNVPHNPTTPNE